MKEQEVLKYRQMLDAGLEYLTETLQSKQPDPLIAEFEKVGEAMAETLKTMRGEVKD